MPVTPSVGLVVPVTPAVTSLSLSLSPLVLTVAVCEEALPPALLEVPDVVLDAVEVVGVESTVEVLPLLVVAAVVLAPVLTTYGSAW